MTKQTLSAFSIKGIKESSQKIPNLIWEIGELRDCSNNSKVTNITLHISTIWYLQQTHYLFEELISDKNFTSKKKVWLDFVINQIYQDYLNYIIRNIKEITESGKEKKKLLELLNPIPKESRADIRDFIINWEDKKEDNSKLLNVLIDMLTQVKANIQAKVIIEKS